MLKDGAKVPEVARHMACVMGVRDALLLFPRRIILSLFLSLRAKEDETFICKALGFNVASGHWVL